MKRSLRDWLPRLLLIAAVTAVSAPAMGTAAPKVTICHFPPGNPANVQLITVGAPAVAAHVKRHNDAVCPAGDDNCCFGGSASSVCTDFSSDPHNCGGCGIQCAAGATCTAGSCVRPCPPGTTQCGGVCVNESTDPSNCGSCGNVCATGAACAAGQCTCPNGAIACNGACVDPRTDASNCGTCGNACPTGAACAAGQCTCPNGTIACNGVCVDPRTDASNCGTCGNACPTGESCSAGSCVSPCPPNTSLCGGVCVNTGSDPSNCGSCGNACPTGESCTDGACVSPCPPNTSLCGGVCVNTSNDPNNCGSCRNPCAAGATCSGGSCQTTCPDGTALCGGACVNVNTDPANCGSCGNGCAAGTICTGGSCVSADVAGSCLPSSSLGILIQGTAPTATVTAYVPLGSWSEFVNDVVAVQLEPTVGAPTTISTAAPVNSCSGNGTTGLTVCTGNSNDVYVINGTTVSTVLTASGGGSQTFSGGACVTCGVATDASTGLAWLAEGTAASTGQLQSLAPTTSTLGTPFDLFGELTSENISVDPVRHLILSAVESGNFQIIDTTSGRVFNSGVNFALTLNATAEDCSTGVAVAPGEFSSSILFVDLSQAVYTPGAPGSWSAPTSTQTFPEFSIFTAAGLSGIAVAPGSHLAGVTDEFGGAAFGVVQLPATSGTGTPSAVDYVAATVPNDPSGAPWNMGLDPHTMTAYSSPNTGRAILAISNVTRTYLALVDMQALLAASRTPGTHTVDPSVDLVGTGIVTFVLE